MVSKKLLLEPRNIWWERDGVFNPGITEFQGRIYMLYRAVGADHISRFGLAISEDGETFERFDQPILEGDERNIYERLGIEDPRITKIDRDYFITYTAASVYPTGHSGPIEFSLNTSNAPWRIRACAYRTRDFTHFEKLGIILPNLDTKDALLFNRKIQNKYWLLHRILPAIYVSVSADIKNWGGGYQLLAPKERWESEKIGAACPPIETEKGWLLFYHGVDSKGVYRTGAVLLDRENPAFILGRTKHPIIEPTESWEKRGAVPNVVFITGAVLKNNYAHFYYGGGDKVVGLAKISVDAIFKSLSS